MSTISNENYVIITHLLQTGSLPLATDSDLWALAEKIKTPTHSFSAARVFSAVYSHFPHFMTSWYVSEVKTVVQQYHSRFISEIPVEVRQHPETKKTVAALCSQPLLTQEVFQKIRMVMQLQKSAKMKVTQQAEKERQHSVEMLAKLKDDFLDYMDEATLSTLRQHQIALKVAPEPLSEKHLSALRHIHYVSQELKSGVYEKKTIQIVLKLLMKMTALGTRQESLQHYLELKAIARDKKIHKGELFFTDEKGQRIAKLRSQYCQIKNDGKERELAAYEVEHVLGGDHVPAAIRVENGNTLQKYVPSSETIKKFLETNEKAASIIKTLDCAYMHSFLTFSLIRGRADGHGENSVIETRNDETFFLHDIDEEVDFFHVNQHLGSGANEGDLTSNIPAMGFPQAKEPYSLVMVKLFSWEGIKQKAMLPLYTRNLTRYTKALEERLNKIIEVFRFESQKKTPTVTPRDLYFLIYGKDFLYERLLQSGCTDYEFFEYAVKCDDDNWRAYKVIERTAKPILNTNLVALSSSFTTPQFSMSSPIKEQYPGDDILRAVEKEIVASEYVTVMKIPSGSFEKKGWNDYKKTCLEDERTVQPFMLSYFLQGFAKRMARQLSTRYPGHLLEITPDDYLQMTKSLFNQPIASKRVV